MDKTTFSNFEMGPYEEASWRAFGFYLKRQLSMGRAITIPHFGIFTFSAPDVLLNGVTNPLDRDKQLRTPVFLIAKDFANGVFLQTGIYIDNHIRAYKVQTSGTILQTKVNWTEIAQYCQLTKDSAQFAVNRVIRMLADKCRGGQNTEIEVPEVGNLRIRGNIAAVQFNDELVGNTSWITKRPLSERKKFGTQEALSNNQAKSLSRTAQNWGIKTEYKNRSVLKDKYYDPNFMAETSSVSLFGYSSAVNTYKCKDESTLQRLRKFLRVSNKSIEFEFKKQDTHNTGIMTNLQFKQAMRNLNFTFTSNEVDELMHLCTFEGQFLWKFFINMIRMRDSDKEFVNDHFQYINHITQLIYTYMLSPKDAFRMFDKIGQGMLLFEQFNALIKQLYFLANEQCLNYTLLQKIFDFIDRDKDKALTLQEWMETFGQIDYTPITSVPKSGLKITPKKQKYIRTLVPPLTAYLDNPHMQTPPKQEKSPENRTQYIVKRVNYNSNVHQPHLLRQPIYQTREEKSSFEYQNSIQPISMGTYEASKDFDKVLQAIARNRKFLLEQFEYVVKNQKLTYEVTKQIIEQMLKNSGVDVKQESWQMLIKFAEKEGIVDYKFLLESYKDRTKKIDAHPVRPLRYGTVQ